MAKFIVAYLLIYSGVHAVVFYRIRVLLPSHGWAIPAVVLFMAAMVVSPLASRVLEMQGHDGAARFVAYSAYLWMGFVFLAFSGSILLYLIDFVSWFVRSLTPLSFPRFSGKTSAAGLLLLSLVLVIYGYFNAKIITFDHLTLYTEKIRDHKENLRVVHISDVHLGIINRETILRKIVEKVKSARPDVLVCTGDLVDGSMQNLMHLSNMIEAIEPPYGKFAVTGNHEYYAGLDHSLEFMRRSGFRVLRQEVLTVAETFNIAGVDDGGRLEEVRESGFLKPMKNGLFTVYLKHRPKVPKSSMGLYDLQLSGHTHNGQIFPFNYLVRLEFPRIQGYYTLDKGSALYVNRGTGTWGPPIRIGSTAEITVIDIKRAVP
ncbi:MAG: metallophosphoesterase [Desulfobacterales bacterium]